MTPFLIAIVGLALGLGIGYYARLLHAKKQIDGAEAIAQKKLDEAKVQEKDILLEAKNQSIKILDDAKMEEKQRREELRKMQERIEQRETMFDKKLMEFEDKKQRLEDKVKEVQDVKLKIDEKHEEMIHKLEKVGALSTAEAKAQLMEHVEQDSKEDLLARKLKLDKVSREEVEEKAKDILVGVMQRTACNHAAETTSTAVSLPSDEMKGRIIGKEGRNIKTLEKLTGCELIIDETPELILVSSFSPIRRRVCYLALEKLIADGRIQPAKIEEYIEEAKRDLAIDIKKAGEQSLNKLGIVVPEDKLVSIIGRLKYRTSYGQNVLNHCEEVGYLSGMIAEELGMDPSIAKKAGYFHDIGKAVDHESEGAHTTIGHTILTKFKMDERLGEVALTHHDTNPPLLLTKIVMAADAISASRVGARRDSVEQYVTRLNELENTAKSFPGVDKAYAIQAGREVRIFVDPNAIDDYQAFNLAKDIARKIEAEHQYPGEIKVMMVRETRVIEYAR
ncbi:MAG: ribonuclease Y [Candidatus Magasanikbacteria bacterium CG11_big_fil_rev_8_21_14_0_20_39_34]|uniref:Ribonuclease Y n=1 Tax=Candidatus Magasanikbacteria bacterium CG11_big_fil_rev_8_21_14_0_20_39_34 TaxID=1974653 RepID=A0A2H0N4X0_9BACT|nr:MAG: ribonuclease Y [Candidatus Magasanikbacteria bacterium CG11_big_fil_rev_8_21_14_0_20_39_34]